MKDKGLEKIALFRYGIIAPLVTAAYGDQTYSQYCNETASKTYENPRGEDVKISSYTIRRWHKNYKENGFDGLKPKRRVDRGMHRKLDSDITSQIDYIKKEYPRLPATLIHQ